MRLIVIPLAVMFILAMLSATGLGTTYLANIRISGNVANEMYYDEFGNAKVYVANLSAVAEAGDVVQVFGLTDFVTNPDGWAAWDNDSTTFGVHYPLYYANGQMVSFGDVGKTQVGTAGTEVDVSSSLGFIALVVGLMALAVVVGVRVLGSGTSETSVSTVVKGTAYLGLWGVFSFVAMGLMTQLPLGSVAYLGLTLMYVLGVINQFGHPGDD